MTRILRVGSRTILLGIVGENHENEMTHEAFIETYRCEKCGKPLTIVTSLQPDGTPATSVNCNHCGTWPVVFVTTKTNVAYEEQAARTIIAGLPDELRNLFQKEPPDEDQWREVANLLYPSKKEN